MQELPASINLLETLLAVQSSSSFLVIGAYRSNEVGPDHPLMASRKRMRGEGDRVTVLTLDDLAAEHTNQLLADSGINGDEVFGIDSHAARLPGQERGMAEGKLGENSQYSRFEPFCSLTSWN